MRSHRFRRNYNKEYLIFKKYGYLKRRRKYYKTAKLLKSGFFDTQTWGALHKAWVGYVIARHKDEDDNLKKYASIFQKLEKELGIEISDFPHIGMMASSLEDVDEYRDDEEDEKYT